MCVTVSNSKHFVLFFQDLRLHGAIRPSSTHQSEDTNKTEINDSIAEKNPVNWPFTDIDAQPLADQQQFHPTTILTANACIQTQLPVCLSCCKCKLWWL